MASMLGDFADVAFLCCVVLEGDISESHISQVVASGAAILGL